MLYVKKCCHDNRLWDKILIILYLYEMGGLLMDRFTHAWFHVKVPSFLEDIFLTDGKVVNYKKGDILADIEDMPTNLYYIKSGVCIFSELSIEGKYNSVGVLLPKSSYGEPAFMNDYNRVIITALEPTQVLSMPINTIYEKLLNNIDGTKALIKFLLEKINSIEYLRYDIITQNVQQRLASFLKSYVHYTNTKISSKGYYKLDIKVTHDLLAEILNATRTSISLVLAYLKKQNLLYIEQKYLHFTEKLISDNMIDIVLKDISWAEIRKHS